MSKLILLGISGKARAGKDSTADYIIKTIGGSKDSFARPVKEVVKAAYGFYEDQLYGNQKDTIDEYWGITPRHAFQLVGTDLFRAQVDKDFWVKAFLRSIKDKEGLLIVPDVRFPNEVKAIKDNGGQVWRVIRKDFPTPKDEHISETILDDYKDWDLVIKCNTGLDRLHRLTQQAIDINTNFFQLTKNLLN
jgi:hypothetical protein